MPLTLSAIDKAIDLVRAQTESPNFLIVVNPKTYWKLRQATARWEWKKKYRNSRLEKKGISIISSYSYQAQRKIEIIISDPERW